MYQPLPSFPPLYAPGAWWRIHVASLLDGRSIEEATGIANRSAGIKPREWMRIRVEGDAVLSLPVDGGASALKNRHPDSWRMAGEAGRDLRKIHSTLNTLYGRTPYYFLLEDSLNAEGAPGDRAKDVCTRAYKRIKAILGLDDPGLVKDIGRELERGSETLLALYNEKAKAFSPALSIIDTIVRIGPDAIFALLPTYKTK